MGFQCCGDYQVWQLFLRDLFGIVRRLMGPTNTADHPSSPGFWADTRSIHLYPPWRHIQYPIACVDDVLYLAEQDLEVGRGSSSDFIVGYTSFWVTLYLSTADFSY